MVEEIEPEENKQQEIEPKENKQQKKGCFRVGCRRFLLYLALGGIFLIGLAFIPPTQSSIVGHKFCFGTFHQWEFYTNGTFVYTIWNIDHFPKSYGLWEWRDDMVYMKSNPEEERYFDPPRITNTFFNGRILIAKPHTRDNYGDLLLYRCGRPGPLYP